MQRIPASSSTSLSTASATPSPDPQSVHVASVVQDGSSNVRPDPAPSTSNHLAPPKKPKLTTRITRMFSQNKISGNAAETSLNGSSKADAVTNGAGESEGSQGTSRQGSASSRQQSFISTKPSASDGEKKTSNGESKHKDGDPLALPKRFEALPNGSHEHRLRGIKRQEKLSDLLRDKLGGRRKDDQQQQQQQQQAGDEQQLSLMSSWVDQLKNEREKLATDKKVGANTNATLVEKYGKCQEIIGRGAFGVVRVSHKIDPKDSKLEHLYAVKEFRRRPQESPKKYQKRLTSEFCISSSLRHPNVIHTLDLLQDAKGDYCEVMEFCAGGDLYTLILASGKLDAGEADCFFKQLMRGVEYMHEMGVAHRDLKPENV